MMFVPYIGDRISNGAVIIDLKRAWDPDAYVALCLWTEDTQGVEPVRRNADLYVTWNIYADPNTAHSRTRGNVIARNGHYHDKLSDAVVDFNSRV
jgi:hypothetical protein